MCLQVRTPHSWDRLEKEQGEFRKALIQTLDELDTVMATEELTGDRHDLGQIYDRIMQVLTFHGYVPDGLHLRRPKGSVVAPRPEDQEGEGEFAETLGDA